MLTHNQKAALGESKAVSWLLSQGYSVFTSFDGKSPFDLVAYKDGKLIRVEVKTTSSKQVSLRTVTHRKGGVKAMLFDSTRCDLLLVYSIELDRIYCYDPALFHGRTAITLEWCPELVTERPAKT